MGWARGPAGPCCSRGLPRRCLPSFLHTGRGRGADPGRARQRASALRRLRDGPVHLGGRHVRRLLRGRLHGQRVRHHGCPGRRPGAARHRRRVLRALQRLLAGGPGLLAIPRPVPLGLPGGAARGPRGEPRGGRRLRPRERLGRPERRGHHRGGLRGPDRGRRADGPGREGRMAHRGARERGAPGADCRPGGCVPVECGVAGSVHAGPRAARPRRGERGAREPARGIPSLRDCRWRLHAQRAPPDLPRSQPSRVRSAHGPNDVDGGHGDGRAHVQAAQHQRDSYEPLPQRHAFPGFVRRVWPVRHRRGEPGDTRLVVHAGRHSDARDGDSGFEDGVGGRVRGSRGVDGAPGS